MHRRFQDKYLGHRRTFTQVQLTSHYNRYFTENIHHTSQNNAYTLQPTNTRNRTTPTTSKTTQTSQKIKLMDRGLHSSSILFICYLMYSQLECICLYNKVFLLKKKKRKEKKNKKENYKKFIQI
jgi:hypothetical protein